MARRNAASIAIATIGVALAGIGPLAAEAGEFGRWFRGLAAPARAIHRQPPPPAPKDCIADLAARIDWLQHHIEAHGTIVAKQPDVWGQSRLTRHRQEYEDQMRRQLGAFTERTSAALRRSDQAYLGLALAMQSAAGRRPAAGDVAVPDVTSSNNVINSIQGMIPTGNEAAGRGDPVVIARTAPLAFPENPSGFRFTDEPLALEPTVHIDQLSRYLNHLQELRRVNEGDDSSDAPGYSLNLVRIPVSVTPGRLTAKGHGAQITITADPCLGDDLLPTTFRSLVINDLVDTIAPALHWAVNDPECVAWARTITSAAEPAAVATARPAARQGVMAAMQALKERLPAVVPSATPAVKTRRSRLPLPFSQLADAAGIEQVAILIRDARAGLASHPANDPCIGYLDIRGYLAEELEAASDFLARDEQRHFWSELGGWNLPGLVRGRRARDLAAARCRFFGAVGTGDDAGIELIDAAPADGAAAADPTGICCEAGHPATPVCRTTTVVLAWAILVEATLLDERLVEDIRTSASARGHASSGGCFAGPFYGPDPPPEARRAFADYVRTRWPIRVFALDPVTDEQNVDDSYSRRRELQLAAAMAAASGRMNAQALARYTRRMELDMATVDLNRTAVGFAHGEDTFGWRFYPRVQSPPTRGTLATLGETIRGGPTTAGDLAQRRLEPGQRECTAIVVMPSFVPWVTFDVRTSWFSLAHPGTVEQTMRETMVLSRSVKAMQDAAAACSHCADDYRSGEPVRLLKSVDKLERLLPLQTLQAQVPHENTAGGFELFNAGITDLAPELLGWYGAPGIDPAGTTTLFLVGKGFSIHDTSVIAGGKPARISLVSREVLRVDVPPGVATIVPPARAADAAAVGRRAGLRLVSSTEPLPAPTEERTATDRAAPVNDCTTCDPAGIDCNRREAVDIHLATPYGVSGHLLVPVARRTDAARDCTLAFVDDCRIDLTFTPMKTAGSRTESARVDEFFSATCDAVTIAVPASFIPPPKAALRLLLRDESTGATAASFSFDDPFFDARGSRYVIAGGDLRNFVGDTSRPATDKTLRGAVKPYLDYLLQQGGLADDGESVPFKLTAAIVAGQQEVPIDGAIAVQATRRGKTIVEPKPDPAPTTGP